MIVISRNRTRVLKALLPTNKIKYFPQVRYLLVAIMRGPRRQGGDVSLMKARFQGIPLARQPKSEGPKLAHHHALVNEWPLKCCLTCE